MDEEIPSIELKLKFQDIDSHLYFSIYLVLYLFILFIISSLIYIYITIFEKINKIFWNHREYIDDIF